MNPTIQSQLVLATFAGWVGLQQTCVIDDLVEETLVTKEQFESNGRRMRLTDCDDGFLNETQFLIIDRDSIFSSAFKSIVASTGVEVLLTAYHAPNMNAHAERFIRSIKAECLGQMIFRGSGRTPE
jgi:hypothetical protein